METELPLFTDADKPNAVEFIKKFIKNNGYIRVGYWVKHHAADKQFKDDAHRAAFINSVSAMLVNTGKYVREVNKKDPNDYDILLNSSYYLNKSIKTTSQITAALAALALGFSMFQIFSDTKVSIPQLQELTTEVKNQSKAIQSLDSSLKMIDLSNQKTLRDSTKK